MQFCSGCQGLILANNTVNDIRDVVCQNGQLKAILKMVAEWDTKRDKGKYEQIPNDLYCLINEHKKP